MAEVIEELVVVNEGIDPESDGQFGCCMCVFTYI